MVELSSRRSESSSYPELILSVRTLSRFTDAERSESVETGEQAELKLAKNASLHFHNNKKREITG